MGTQPSKGLSRQVQQKKINQKQTIIQFQPCFQKMQNNPNFLSDLLIQNPKISKNILKYFPHAHKNYEQFVQLGMFLRKVEIRPQKSMFAKHNSQKTSLIDRYFILSQGIQKQQQLAKVHVNLEAQQNLLIDLMRIFIPDPKSGFIHKLSKFLKIANDQTPSLKAFSNSIKQNFPQIYKHLRDYWTLKLRDMKKQAYLLQNFKSNILQEDAVILSLKIPEMTGKQIKQLYSSESNGLSFHAYQKRIIGYTGPWLLVLQSKDKETYRFGSFQTGPIRDIIDYQGDLRGFMFAIQPNIRFMTTDKGQNGNHYFFINNIDEKISKKRRGIGFGGDFAKNNCKLWIDQDLDKSTVFNGNDLTYGYGNLANPMSTALTITKMQIWGLGTKFDIQKQQAYWQQRQQQIMKRRKVNKKQLIDGNAGLIFQKTFAHRDQVVGQIQRSKKQDNS